MPERMTAYHKGIVAENTACEYLLKKGMVLLARRYRSLYGEIDLVLREGGTLVFAEVKARARGGRGAGLSAVTPLKRKRLIQTASLYLAESGESRPCRFDVVEITPEGIAHIRGAFDASGVW